MDAIFHCLGTIDELSERLNKQVSGLQKIGAQILKNQAGNESIHFELIYSFR